MLLFLPGTGDRSQKVRDVCSAFWPLRFGVPQGSISSRAGIHQYSDEIWLSFLPKGFRRDNWDHYLEAIGRQMWASKLKLNPVVRVTRQSLPWSGSPQCKDTMPVPHIMCWGRYPVRQIQGCHGSHEILNRSCRLSSDTKALIGEGIPAHVWDHPSQLRKGYCWAALQEVH